MKRLAPLLACALAALAGPGAAAGADPFPDRRGTSGVLDVPDAETVGRGGGLVGGELRLDLKSGQAPDAGPMPVSVVTGLASRVEAGFFMREWGYPGDPSPSPLLFGAALKLQLVEPDLARPGLALVVTSDRFNWKGGVLGAQLAASTRQLGPVRLTASLGADAHGTTRVVTGGLAATLQILKDLDVAAEGVRTADGPVVGAAVRYRVFQRAGVSLGVSWLPDQSGVRLSLGLAMLAAAPRRKATRLPAETEEAPPPTPPEEPIATGPQFLDDVPHFRLKLHTPHLQHAPWTPPATTASAIPSRATPPARPSAPSAAELAEAKLKDAEAAVAARQRRLQATEEQLRAREADGQAEAARLAAAEQDHRAREQRLDAREQTLHRGTPTTEERQVESQEAQLAASERQLAAQERGTQVTVDAAAGRERDAGGREAAERQDAERAAAAVLGLADRAKAVELRQQGLAARQRELAATEARLVAKGERLDAQETQLRTRGERLDAMRRRLDLRATRLDAVARRTTRSSTPTGVEPPPPGAAAAAVPLKDRAVFVMVVKTPAAVLKDGGQAGALGAAPSPAQAGAVENAVAAATLVTFPTPQSELTELDWEGVDRVAALAAREGCELLIWARAQTPGLLGEANRRVMEIKLRLAEHGQISDRQVVTRVTTRPGAVGVDVVISALRDQSLTPGAPVATLPADPGARRGANAELLQSGETGKHQLRDAVRVVQPSIESCIGNQVLRKQLTRAEGTIKVSVSKAGRVVRLSASEGDLGGPELQECLGQAAASWMFPPSTSEYVVEIPITIVVGGAKR